MVLEVIANIYPAKGKEGIIREGLQDLAKSVTDNEPNVSRYQVYEQTNAEGDNVPQFVVVEEYADKAAFDNHVNTKAFQELAARAEKEELLAKPLDIKFVEKIGGFLSR